jgi:formylglycine-generating enzyme required for sulfatase activity
MPLDDGREMVRVPAGPFIMGSDEFARERPIHTRDLPAFWIDRFPVTNEAFLHFVRATGHRTPVDWVAGVPRPGTERHPVMVTWTDADAYAPWAGKRLPTEAEWEKAARGTDGRRYPWGETWDTSRARTWETTAVGDRLEDVDARPSGASPYGAEQMVGLLEEWCADWYDAYPGSTYSSLGYGERYRVLRGGAWIFTQTHARCAYRCFELPSRPPEEMAVLGAPTFRCVRDDDGLEGTR